MLTRNEIMTRQCQAFICSGLSYTRLAQALGCSVSQAQNYGKGRDPVPIDKLPVLCRALGITIPWLLFGEDALSALYPDKPPEHIELLKKLQTLSDANLRRLAGYLDALG